MGIKIVRQHLEDDDQEREEREVQPLERRLRRSDAPSHYHRGQQQPRLRKDLGQRRASLSGEAREV